MAAGTAGRILACAAIIWSWTAAAQVPFEWREFPTFAELEAAGAVIGRIRINPQDIFDLADPRENNRLFRLANRLHAQTRPQTIERQLLFKPGERVSVRVIEETERLLRSNRYLYDVTIRPVEYRDGVVDIEVSTRDTWTLDFGLSFARAGGSSSHRTYLQEYNLLGTGASLGVTRSANVERSGTELSLKDNHLFGPWLSLDASLARLNDNGRAWSLGLARPFYSLDTPYAAGFSVSRSDTVSTIYEQGVSTAKYRTQSNAWDAFGGWSSGRTQGWVRRYVAGFSYDSNSYRADPDQPPSRLPSDRTLAGPFIRYELLEDNYEKVVNRDQIGRPEYFAMGFQSRLQLGRALSGFGSTEDSWLYEASLSKGFRSLQGNTLLIGSSVSGRVDDQVRRNQLISGYMRYYVPQRGGALFSASFSGDVYRSPDKPDALQLGGDTGLRGYPLSYQSGERRVLMTLEERVYTDWYPYRLFRVGGAVFVDVGRAWHGSEEVSAGQRVLSDWGFGLRLGNARSALGGVLHVDLAFPLNARDQVRSVQFLVRSYASF